MENSAPTINPAIEKPIQEKIKSVFIFNRLKN